jgi:FKBP-type peptidyl-prolyl cis-trans isomerase
MATVPQRIFAASGAILFFLTSIALSVVVIFTVVQDNKTKNNTNTTAKTSCDISTPVASNIMTAPEVYKPTDKVDSLQTTDLEPGNGQAAKNGDCLVMKYQGNLASDGTIFDENYSKPQALQFTLGQGQVIPGWDQGLVGMKVGGTRRLVIPSALGYGAQGSGSIPANADLVFVVKLVSIK